MPSNVRIVRKATNSKPVGVAAGSTSATPAADSSAAATPREGSSDDTAAPDVSSLIDELNYANAPRPFKNPNYAQKVAGNRRVKTAKQIIQLERERYVKPKKKARVAAQSQSVTAAGTPVDGMDVDDEAAQAAATAEALAEPEVVRKEDYIAYHEYEAPPSLRPSKKYCDVTGLEAPYTDPKSRLRYHNADIYELLKQFSSGAEQEYLMLRGQGMVIR